MDMDLSFKYPDTLRKYYQRNDECEGLIGIMDQLAEEYNCLQTAETCLSVGTGYGLCDIEFIKRCLPALKKFVVVEKDPDGVRELKINLKNAFGDNLQVEIHEMKIENFMENLKNWKDMKKVDVVVSFHSLYFLTPSDRMNFFKSCLDSCLKPGVGLLMLALISMEHSLVRLQEEMQPYVDLIVYSEQLKEELKMLKLDIDKSIPYGTKMDLNEYDRDLNEMMKFTHKVPVSDDMMEKAISIIAPTGWGSCSCELILLKHQS